MSYSARIETSPGFRFIGCLVLLAWLQWADTKQWLEPLLTLILLGVAWLTGSQIFSDLSALRANAQALPLESNEDPTTEPWRITNHSIHEIRWNPETNSEHLKTLCSFWSEHCSHWPRAIFPRFDHLLEETSTINFRVQSLFEEIRFLRLHRAPLAGELECRRLLAERLKEANIFPQRFANYLIPVPLNSGLFSQAVLHSSFAPAGRVIGEVLPYAKEVTHFTGRNVTEVESVGRLLGSVQSVLQNFNENIRKSLRPLTSLARNSLPSADDLVEYWKKIETLEQQASLLHPFARLIKLEPKVKDWVREAIETRKFQNDKNLFLLLHDVHPHNVFCKNGECVLIYDYQWLGFWPHGHVIAFTLHRFVRELVVKDENTSADRQRTIDEGVQYFLKAYQNSCSLPLPDDFHANLSAYIRSSNMDKLLNSFWYGLSGQDPLQRSEARLFGEARKFIRYMKEAREFRIA